MLILPLEYNIEKIIIRESPVKVSEDVRDQEEEEEEEGDLQMIIFQKI